MKFKPILAPNQEIDLTDIVYPILASYKYDGIRCIFFKGEILSRSLKPIVNKQLREKFKPITDYTKQYSLILDGEIYSPDLTFQEITSFVMTQDFEDKKSIKKYGEVRQIPKHLNFNCFDCLKVEYTTDNIRASLTTPFLSRIGWVFEIEKLFPNIMQAVKHEWVYDVNDVRQLFKKALADDYEGLILRHSEGHYKFGRCTIKEANIFKVKPFRTFDGTIKEVTQGTEVNPNAEKKINELGRSVTSKKKADRVLIERVRDFVVQYEGKELKVATSSLTHEERKQYWKIKDTLIGKTIEYKGMLVGAKDVPRHPVFLRFIDTRSK